MIYEHRLSDLGRQVGTRMLDLIVMREKGGFKRDIKMLDILLFIKGPVWKVLYCFYKQ